MNITIDFDKNMGKFLAFSSKSDIRTNFCQSQCYDFKTKFCLHLYLCSGCVCGIIYGQNYDKRRVRT